MSAATISPLRRRMIEAMTGRGFGEETRHDHIRQVEALTAFVVGAPDTATPEDLRRFRLRQTETGGRPPGIDGAVAAVRFSFAVTRDRPDLARRRTVVRRPRQPPEVLSGEEVARPIAAAPGPKSEAAVATAHGAGPRVAEVVALEVGDVASARMMLPQGGLFPGRSPIDPPSPPPRSAP